MQRSLTEADGLLSNYVQDMTFDGQGRLWVGTDKGVSVYDGSRFRHFTTASGLDNSYINRILYFPLGDCILLTTGANSIYVIREDSLELYSRASVLHPQALGILPDGTLVITTWKDSVTMELYYVTGNPLQSRKTKVLEYGVEAMHTLLLPNRDTLIYTDGEIFRQKVHFNSLKAIPMRSSMPWTTRVSAQNNQDTVFYSKYGDSISVNLGKGRVISGTGIPGMAWSRTARCYYQGKPALAGASYSSGNLVLLTHDGHRLAFPASVTGFPVITQLLGNHDHNLLVGTMGEGVKLLGTNLGMVYLPGRKIARIGYQAPRMWMVADKNLVFVDADQDKLVQTAVTMDQPTSLSFEQGKLHITTLLSYQVYDITRPESPRTLYINKGSVGLSGFSPQPDGGYFLSTYNGGIWEFDRQHRQLGRRARALGTLHDDIIERIIRVPNARVFTSYNYGAWFAFDGGKRMLLNKDSGLVSNAVYDVGFWNGEWHIGMEAGWQRIKDGRFTTYTSQEGFNGKRAMYSFADRQGRLFVLSEKYLMLEQKGRLRTLYSQPVLPNESSSLNMAWFDTTSQYLWCAGNDGLMKVYIPEVEPDTLRLDPVFYECAVNGRRVKPDAANNIELPAGGAMELDIHCGLSKIDFSGKSRIFYKLEGWNAQYEEMPESFDLSFANLPAGRYALFMFAVNPDGLESAPRKMLTLSVPYPWYLRWPMVLLYIVFAVGIFYRGARIWANRNVARRTRQFLVEKKIQEERNRISSELHDNVGSQLTNIIAQLDFVEGALQMGRKETAMQKVETLQEKARRTMTLLRESIWALKEDAISLQEFMLKVQQYAVNVFDPDSGVQVSILPMPLLKDKLSPWQAVNLLRVVQEAFQNIQKHALGVTTVVIETSLREGVLHMVVKDNGCGFDVYQVVPGQGMGNMQRRMSEMDGSLSLESGPAGTSLVLELPLKKSP